LLRRLVDDQRFALLDLSLVLLSGAVWMLKPEWGFWFLLIALLPWVLRLLAGILPFHRTSFDWLVAVFLITAWVGYWAAYDKTTAWSKVWLIVTAVLLYYSFNAQPRENLIYICALFFCIGVGMSVFYFMTYDFIAAPRKLEFVNQIGRWIMNVRPQVGLNSIHPNYVAGIVAITTPFIFYPLWKLRDRRPVLLYVLVFIGLCLASFAVLMATSRGVIMAIVTAGGLWLLWKITHLDRIKSQFKSEAVFPSLVLIYLFLVVAFLYAGPASSVSAVSGPDTYGTGSRLELFTRSLYFLAVFPITGGGLGSFPGLYSHYMLGVPFFYLPNSHNLFLDVAIEQGLLGGLAFLLIFISSVWSVSRMIVKEQAPDMQIFTWLVLLALVVAFIHGMVDDYLYNGNGTFLSLALAGLSVILKPEQVQTPNRMSLWTIGLISLAIISILVFNLDKFRSVWYANLGAVQAAQVELADFPNGEWVGREILPKLDKADASLHISIQLDPTNQTANYYLGLISMLREDFQPASVYLGEAYQQMPYNRGIIKSLGYCYVWLGDVKQAKRLLAEIPETSDELNVYVWWWETKGRDDLSIKASIMIPEMSGQ